MKTYNKLFILVVLIVFSGCNDAIDIDQPGRLPTEEAFKNLADLQDGLTGLYGLYDTTSEIQFNAVFTDEVSIGFDSGGQGIGNGEYGFVLNPNSAAANTIWASNYAVINFANRIIEASEIITVETGEQEDVNHILGQAYALRAYSHFQIQSYFTTDYTDDTALGGILLDFIPEIDVDTDQSRPRSTNGAVFGLITADLDLAENLLAIESDPIYVSQDFVTALRARMAAYRSQYAQADTYAAELLAKYPIADRSEYEAMYLDEDNTEIIFKLERTLSDNYNGQGSTGSGFAGGWAGANFAFIDATITGSPYFEMGRSVFNLINSEDIRFDVNIDGTSIISDDYQNAADYRNEDILVISKYPGSEGQPLMNDLKVFRSSEMLFIRAEAAASTGNINGNTNSTAAYIKQLRDARFGEDQSLPSYASQTEAFGAILDERRIELVFEGHRYKDLKRLGALGNRGISRDPLDCEVNGACSLEVSDYRFTNPIPIIELTPNTVIDEQQNPGY
ncbi:MAG: RagB/SusD family nutrient uptake outer membrane protein [Flavobacteriaceae bacterium]